MVSWKNFANQRLIARFCSVLLLSTAVSYAAYAQAGNGVDPLALGGVKPTHVPTQPVASSKGMVVSASKLAAEVGANILRQGGNAADAAVAVAYAMAVTYPAAGNIGGGGFLTIFLPGGKSYFVDFREKAPLAAKADMYLDAKGEVIPNASVFGWKAVGVPGTVAGMELVRERWGSKPRKELITPAIKLAQNGYKLTDEDIALFSTSLKELAKDTNAAEIFMKPHQVLWKEGDVFRQENLARTLSLIADEGADVFYKGPIAKEIVSASNKNGGILTLKDFELYKPRVLNPLTCTYRGYVIKTAPPPSGGGVAICEVLNILSGYDMSRLGINTLQSVQRQVEAMRRAYSDRRDLGDPAFVNNRIALFLDPHYAEEIRKNLNFDHAVDSNRLVPGQVQLAGVKQINSSDTHEKNETTHFSIIDQNGMAVSMTYTLNGWFGARLVAGNTGIVMNDEMDDFSTSPGKPNIYGIVGSQANEIEPGKTPLSSMSPTIISKNNKPYIVIGSPGGSRIPTIILNIVTNIIDYNLNIQQAINSPRFHEQWQPSPVQLEYNALSAAVRDGLKRKGYPLDIYTTWGIAEGIQVGSDPHGKKIYYGGRDYRHGGGAVGE
ncbi:Glutathione hydrolase proenzyme [Commensalibacter sp. Nvir]|uniref:gamma-glutamyltransferase n=1 Tax=Commensalibacter sp. Nvir TaxID=3069817 RepID=UPI002D47F6F5|nr:Glutathione hydrolase proenzyme [Commensalibacter sp. Nvir]